MARVLFFPISQYQSYALKPAEIGKSVSCVTGVPLVYLRDAHLIGTREFCLPADRWGNISWGSAFEYVFSGDAGTPFQKLGQVTCVQYILSGRKYRLSNTVITMT